MRLLSNHRARCSVLPNIGAQEAVFGLRSKAVVIGLYKDKVGKEIN